MSDESGSILATAYNEIVKKIYKSFEIGRYYKISKVTITKSNKTFTNVKNDYCMLINEKTIIEEYQEVEDKIPLLEFEFTKIDCIAQMPMGTTVNLIGIVIGKSETFNSTLFPNNNRETSLRKLNITDQSNREIQLILWGIQTSKFNKNLLTVIRILQARVFLFEGMKCLILINESFTEIEPMSEDARDIKDWYTSSKN